MPCNRTKEEKYFINYTCFLFDATFNRHDEWTRSDSEEGREKDKIIKERKSEGERNRETLKVLQWIFISFFVSYFSFFLFILHWWRSTRAQYRSKVNRQLNSTRLCNNTDPFARFYWYELVCRYSICMDIIIRSLFIESKRMNDGSNNRLTLNIHFHSNQCFSTGLPEN